MIKTGVLFISMEFPPGPGGIGTHAYEIAKGLNQVGINTTVACCIEYLPLKEAKEFDAQQGFNIIRLPRSRIKRQLSIINIVRKLKPRVIISSCWRGSLYSVIPQFIFNTRRIAVGHGSEFIKNSLFKYLISFVFNTSDKIIAVSNFTKKLMIKSGLDSERISVIYNGARLPVLDYSLINRFKDKYNLSGKRVLLTSGRVCERKGQDTVIKSLPEVLRYEPNLSYIIAGPPEKKEQFQKLAEKLGVQDNIIFTGLVSKEELFSLYYLADIYILNSSAVTPGDIEGFGISIVEAALAEKPSIGTRGCGIEEVIEDGKTGILIEMDSPWETAQAILKILRDESLKFKMGRAARERALVKYSWERAVQETAILVRSLLK